jgi:succinate dehydrogenase / fumarate reductase cytochrome b subunit
MTTPTRERIFERDETLKLPKPFILRRVHSLLGFWLIIYLAEHLLVNSQAALFFQDQGAGFVSAVNQIHALPYLKAIEIVFLALPFLFHGIWGISYALNAKLNAHRTKGGEPQLPQFKRNQAFSWQRITAWLLIVGILAHVIHVRFVNYPISLQKGDETFYAVALKEDNGLPSVAQKLSVKLQKSEEGKPNQVLALSPNIGTAFFLIVREAFKNPLIVVLYSLLVVAACYHAFNGLWTFTIKWGITLSRRAQKRMRSITTILMGIVIFLGLMSAWGTYLTTLWQA